jgi:nicotinamide-nucleotide amidase
LTTSPPEALAAAGVVAAFPTPAQPPGRLLRADNPCMDESLPMLQLADGWQADVQALAEALLARGWMLAAAESCTGGLIAAACTALPGSSRWFERGFVTYGNAAKVEQLGVAQELLDAHGAVSEPVARAMAEGALARSHADLALAVTGIAGPGGAVPGKPVGTVWLAWSVRRAIRSAAGAAEVAGTGVDPAAPAGSTPAPARAPAPSPISSPISGAVRLQLDGDRAHVRALTVQHALRQARALARPA